MSHADHEWARELIAAHLAGGLSAEERARMEAHAASCAECIAELNEAARFEKGLEAAFLPDRAPGLEERTIRALRFAPRPPAWGLFGKLLAGAAAVGLLGAVGYAILDIENALPEPPVQLSLARAEGLAVGQNAWSEDSGGRHRSPAPSAPPPLVEAESLGRMKGDSLDRLGEQEYRRNDDNGLKALQDLDDKVMLVEELQKQQDGQNKAFFAYRDGAPPAPSEGKDLYFKPGQLAASLGVKAGEERAKLMKNAAPANERSLQRRQAEGGAAGGGAGPAQEPPQPVRKIIRSGDVEFEVESFDTSVALIQKIAAEEKGFIGTVNSEKLANGKVRGSVVVRVPPDHLDTLLLKLRGLGELKSQRIGSQDVTKAFYDTESRLRAARAMEERLLRIIKEGKGEIKDLLLAEKELGEWRTRIEQAEGEIRYYNNLINLSTLTITLQEKELRAAAGVVRTERVDMAVEVEDVEKAHRDALAAIAEAKGRVTRSELKQHAAGQLSSLIHFEAAPDAAGPLRDRLRQLGVPARMDVNVSEENEGPVRAGAELRVTRKDSQFQLSMYNVANIQPRETTQTKLVSLDVEKTYKEILSRVEKAGGRVVSSVLNRQRSDQTTATVLFEVKTAEAEALIADVRGLGEVLELTTTENPDAQNVTKSKRGVHVQLVGMGHVAPRESTQLTLAAKDVATSYKALLEAAAKAEAWVLTSHLAETDPRNVRAVLKVDVRRDQEGVIATALAAAGSVYSRTSRQAPPNSGAVASKVQYEITVFDRTTIQPRETHTVGVEVGQVDVAGGLLEKIAAEGKGEVEDVSHTRDSRSGRQASTYTLRLPLAEAGATLERLKTLGSVKEMSGQKNTSVPLNEVAVAKVVVTLSNDLILAPDAGPWANIKRGLGVSLTALSYALMLIMVGVCFVLPIALLAWGGLRLWRKVKAKPA